ncbi:hypothetical protein LCDV1gp083 [Lymphocystis disease virus 1]|uniref:hypothetical protein n=1 Tax=Fish lymphocystis disease virus TaxID=36363 RepID=UPI0000161ED0|nr:hypothetical protein LCDV1gp083 [Lymphocystis disease virus 1]
MKSLFKPFAITALKNFLKLLPAQDKSKYNQLLLSEGIYLEKITLFNDVEGVHRLVSICHELLNRLITKGYGLKYIPYKFFKQPTIYKILKAEINGFKGEKLISIFIEICLKNKWNAYTYLLDILNEDYNSCITGQFVRITTALIPFTNIKQNIYEYEKAKFFHRLNERADSIRLIESVQSILNSNVITLPPKKYIKQLLKEYTGVEWCYHKNKLVPM